MYLLVIAIVLIVVSILISVLISAKNKKQEDTRAKLKDFKFPVPDEGTAQQVIFGDVWTTDWQVLAVSNYQTEAIYSSSSGGKK